MRMWMIPPEKMCDQHARGEHGELHKLVGSINHDNLASPRGLIKKGYINLSKVRQRHNHLENYMGYNSPLPEFDIDRFKEKYQKCEIDKKQSWRDLVKRCKDCRELLENNHCRVHDVFYDGENCPKCLEKWSKLSK